MSSCQRTQRHISYFCPGFSISFPAKVEKVYIIYYLSKWLNLKQSHYKKKLQLEIFLKHLQNVLETPLNCDRGQTIAVQNSYFHVSKRVK